MPRNRLDIPQNIRIPGEVPKPRTPPKRKAKAHHGLMLLCLRHLQAALVSLGQMRQAVITTMMILIVIGIAMALPTGLFVLLNNAQRVGTNWDGSTQISLYLKQDVTKNRAQNLMQVLQQDPGVGSVRYISPSQGMTEFKRATNFGDALNALKSNPLPAVLVVTPALNLQTPAAINHLLQNLKHIPQVSVAELDMQWVKRLFAIFQLAEHFVYALAVLFGLGVLLVIGNTIHLATQRYLPEIKVMKFVGATDAFVRRPFLYTGMFYGLLGGIIAWIAVGLMLWSLQGTASELAKLYGSDFVLQGLNFEAGVWLLLLSALLGLLGSCFAVNKHLRAL